MILTIDLGTSVTKAALWDTDGLVVVGRAPLSTVHRAPGFAEQEPSRWWPSVVEAIGALGGGAGLAGSAAGRVDAVVFASARQSFVPVTATGEALGPAVLWSDRRAGAEAEALSATCGGAEQLRQRTGVVLDGAAVAAKIAWLTNHEIERLSGAAWLLSPRDLMVWHLTGVVATDATLASATGLYDADGAAVPELVGAAAGRLPDVVAPDTVIGSVRRDQAAAVGLRAGTPVVIGAGDRQCEVLGTGASAASPMVAWGTTANVSVPVSERPDPVPSGVVVTRAALGGWLVEGGLSAAGSLLAWLARLTGVEVERLGAAARSTPPGAGGVVALPWMGGARAPWWDDDARAGFIGLGFEHGPADLARAIFEAVAFDVARCLDRMATIARPTGFAIGGSAATDPTWTDVLTGVTGLPALQRRSGEAAMAGAALVASAAVGAGYELEYLDPVEVRTTPVPEIVRRYRDVRAASDRIAATMVGLRGDVAISVV